MPNITSKIPYITRAFVLSKNSTIAREFCYKDCRRVRTICEYPKLTPAKVVRREEKSDSRCATFNAGKRQVNLLSRCPHPLWTLLTLSPPASIVSRRSPEDLCMNIYSGKYCGHTPSERGKNGEVRNALPSLFHRSYSSGIFVLQRNPLREVEKLMGWYLPGSWGGQADTSVTMVGNKVVRYMYRLAGPNREKQSNRDYCVLWNHLHSHDYQVIRYHGIGSISQYFAG